MPHAQVTRDRLPRPLHPPTEVLLKEEFRDAGAPCAKHPDDGATRVKCAPHPGPNAREPAHVTAVDVRRRRRLEQSQPAGRLESGAQSAPIRPL